MRSLLSDSTPDEMRASADYEVFRAAEEDESVIGVSKAEAARFAGEARELVGEVPF